MRFTAFRLFQYTNEPEKANGCDDESENDNTNDQMTRMIFIVDVEAQDNQGDAERNQEHIE